MGQSIALQTCIYITTLRIVWLINYRPLHSFWCYAFNGIMGAYHQIHWNSANEKILSRTDQISNGLNGGEQSRMEHKLGQMVISTQQLLLSQQATSQRLQSDIQKLSSEVNNLREEMVEMKDLCMEPHQGSSEKSKSTAGLVKVPIELYIRKYVAIHLRL